MPTYEYKCTDCAHTLEAFQSMKDAPLEICPECGKKSLKRLIGTGAGIIFKGNGFYQTDYRSENYRKASEKEKSSAAPSPEKSKKTSADSKKNDSSAKKSGD